jgi:hypothetical protein
MITIKPVRRAALLRLPVIVGTASMATPIRSTKTPKYFNNVFMVIDIYNYFSFSAHK